MRFQNNTPLKLISGMLALLLISIACQVNFAPADTKSMVQTSVAQTVAAKQQLIPTLTTAPQILPTLTPKPTSTLPSPPTAAPKPCNRVQFISETIADNTVMDPNETFTKSWRFKNTGTCTWNTNYKLVFSDGSKMSGTSPKKFTQTVAPGEQVDIRVDLKAPASAGTYKGVWRLQDDEGSFFVNNIWVQIKVTVPLTEHTVTLDVVPAESGTVWESGEVFVGDIAAGDAATNKGVQAFVSFNISGIPTSANILEVKMDFTDYALLGDPFSLGCLRMYAQAYRPLDSSDYFSGTATDALIKWCDITALDAVTTDEDVATALEARFGKTYLPLRLQFNENETNTDFVNDAVGWNSMKLIVKYES